MHGVFFSLGKKGKTSHEWSLRKSFFFHFSIKLGKEGQTSSLQPTVIFAEKNAPFPLFFSSNFPLSINHREERKPGRGGDLKAYSQTGEEVGPILFIFLNSFCEKAGFLMGIQGYFYWVKLSKHICSCMNESFFLCPLRTRNLRLEMAFFLPSPFLHFQFSHAGVLHGF